MRLLLAALVLSIPASAATPQRCEIRITYMTNSPGVIDLVTPSEKECTEKSIRAALAKTLLVLVQAD